jgi:hypothetical protein
MDDRLTPLLLDVGLVGSGCIVNEVLAVLAIETVNDVGVGVDTASGLVVEDSNMDDETGVLEVD